MQVLNVLKTLSSNDDVVLLVTLTARDQDQEREGADCGADAGHCLGRRTLAGITGGGGGAAAASNQVRRISEDI